MTKYLRRPCGSGTLHFVTCSCYRRLPLLGSACSRDVFVRMLEETRVRYQFALNEDKNRERPHPQESRGLGT